MKFQSTSISRLATALALALIVTTAACSGKKTKTDDTGSAPVAPAVVEENALGDSDSGKAMGLQTIHFPYDSFVLDGQAKSALKSNADTLKDKSSAKVQIEGHCDQRGGIQYNIALGEKRANVVKKYLQGLGVSADRVTTISYGKERPIDSAESEEAYSKNRRANFVITTR